MTLLMHMAMKGWLPWHQYRRVLALAVCADLGTSRS